MTKAQPGSLLRSAGTVVAVVLPFLFLVMGARRAYPFVDDVSAATSTGDDWLTYKTLALSVTHGGLTIPGQAGTYAVLPHGFLYVYFLALLFLLFGINSAYVYVIQSLMCGVSVSLTYLAVRKKFSPSVAFAFLIALTGLMYVEVYRAVTFRLLSENLYFLLSSIALIFLLRVFGGPEARRAISPFFAGLALGLVVLTRPSLVLSAAAVLTAIWVHARATGLTRRVPFAATLGAAAGVSGDIIRDYVVSGRATFEIVSNTTDWIRIWNLPNITFSHALASRVLFAFGIPRFMDAAYRLRPQWIVLWVACGAYVALKLARHRSLEIWEILLYVYIACYIVPVIAVADISSYGGRMVSTIMPVVLILGFRLVEELAVRPASRWSRFRVGRDRPDHGSPSSRPEIP